jgi:hypothetical protein
MRRLINWRAGIDVGEAVLVVSVRGVGDRGRLDQQVGLRGHQWRPGRGRGATGARMALDDRRVAHTAAARSASARAMTSTPPPAPNGAMIRTVRSGNAGSGAVGGREVCGSYPTSVSGASINRLLPLPRRDPSIVPALSSAGRSRPSPLL